MNQFLASLEITFRRDPTNFRPRVNKLNSVKDREQKGEAVEHICENLVLTSVFFREWKLFLPGRLGCDRGMCDNENVFISCEVDGNRVIVLRTS